MIYRAFIRVYCQIHSKCYGCSEFRLRISGRSIVRSIQLASHNIKINFSNYILMYFAAQNSFIRCILLLKIRSFLIIAIKYLRYRIIRYVFVSSIAHFVFCLILFFSHSCTFSYYHNTIKCI